MIINWVFFVDLRLNSGNGRMVLENPSGAIRPVSKRKINMWRFFWSFSLIKRIWLEVRVAQLTKILIG